MKTKSVLDGSNLMLENRPCNFCRHLQGCTNTKCRPFNDWCNSGKSQDLSSMSGFKTVVIRVFGIQV